MQRYIVAFSVLVLLGGCASIERVAIPKKQLLDPRFTEIGSATYVDHEAWNRFLRIYTVENKDGDVRVRYAAVTPADQQDLKAYIAGLSRLDKGTLTRGAQLAYWSNLYNAKTIDVVLDHYPVDSIRKIKDGVLDLGPWENKSLTIAGRPTSLHDIEHGIVRPLWSDTPEIHYILNCAAAGCPNLSRQAYTADNIEAHMSRAATEYVNDPAHGVRINAKGHVYVSKIYLWYREDFGDSQGSILKHLMDYAAPALKSQLEKAESISGYFYDWSLNDAPH
jgi:hypothetical protein